MTTTSNNDILARFEEQQRQIDQLRRENEILRSQHNLYAVASADKINELIAYVRDFKAHMKPLVSHEVYKLVHTVNAAVTLGELRIANLK